MIANLGMYDVPIANSAFWMLIRRALGYGPDTLTNTDDVWGLWQSPDLLLSQTCGYPYRARLHGTVALLGTPDYGLADCDPGFYRSVFIARKADARTDFNDFSGTRFAFNDAMSQSGWAGPVTHMEALDMSPGALICTGSHAGSINAVADGLADFAAIDAMTWQLVARSEMDVTDHVHVIAQTAQFPGLPFITALGRDVGAIQTAIDTAIDEMPTPLRQLLPIHQLVRIPATAYLAVRTPATPDA